jgi:hypothetical protein
MPGRYDSKSPGASFLSAWQLYRSGLIGTDDTAHPELVPALDLSKSFHGSDSEIVIAVHRTVGSGSIDLALYRKNNGSLASVSPYQLIASYTNTIDADHAFINLLAGEYVILVTNIAGGTTVQIHVATNSTLIL